MTKKKEQELRYISLDLIDEPPVPARTESIEEGLQELAASIKSHGVIEPLILQPRGGRYEIVAGHRRFLAAKMAAVVQVPAIVRSRSDSVNREELIHENLHRTDMTAYEEANLYNKLVQEHGMSQGEVGKAIGKTAAHVGQRIAMLKWDEDLLAYVRSKVITFSVGRMLMEIKDKANRTYYIDVVARGGASYAVVEGWVRGLNNPPPSPPVGGEGSSPPGPVSGPSVYRPICWLCGTAAEMSDLTTVQLDRDCARVMREAFLESRSASPPAN